MKNAKRQSREEKRNKESTYESQEIVVLMFVITAVRRLHTSAEDHKAIGKIINETVERSIIVIV